MALVCALSFNIDKAKQLPWQPTNKKGRSAEDRQRFSESIRPQFTPFVSIPRMRQSRHRDWYKTAKASGRLTRRANSSEGTLSTDDGSVRMTVARDYWSKGSRTRWRQGRAVTRSLAVPPLKSLFIVPVASTQSRRIPLAFSMCGYR
jgi:hypothetical protein